MIRCCSTLFLVAAMATGEEMATGDLRMQLHNLADQNVGVFFTGNETVARSGLVNEQDPDFETLTEVLQPHATSTHTIHHHHGFMLRTADMQHRFKVAIFPNDEGDSELADFPHKLVVKNVMLDEPVKQIELKHGSSGYVWIEPGHEVTHKTGHGHAFEIRDKQNAPLVSVTLGPLHDEF